MDQVISYLKKIRDIVDKKELIDEAIIACAAYDPKCHECIFYVRSMSGDECLVDEVYNHNYGYDCKHFQEENISVI